MLSRGQIPFRNLAVIGNLRLANRPCLVPGHAGQDSGSHRMPAFEAEGVCAKTKCLVQARFELPRLHGCLKPVKDGFFVLLRFFKKKKEIRGVG